MTCKSILKFLSVSFSLITLLAVSAHAQHSTPTASIASLVDRPPMGTAGTVRKTPSARGSSQTFSKNMEVPLFLDPVSYEVSGRTTAAAIGDVNGDGIPDLVLTTVLATPSVAVLLGNGDGTFGPVSIYPGGVTSFGPVALADVNGDGKLDVIIENECAAGETHCGTVDAADGQVGVLLGNGDGTFQAPVFYDAGGESTASVTVADVNRDGKPDIIASNWDGRNNGNNRIGVLLGKGDGTFEPAVTYSSGGYGYETSQTVVVDVNGDNIPDILVADTNGDHGPSDGQLGVLLGNGDGTFQAPMVYDAGAPMTIGLAVADLNGDGKLDVVLASCAYDDCSIGAVGVLLGNGDGTFQPAALYIDGAASGVAIFDADRDGKLDILVSLDGGVQVLLGNGDGTFSPNASFPISPAPLALAAGDLNGDHAPDLVFPTNSGTVAVLLANTRALTATTLKSSLNPAVYGQAVGFKVTVTSSSGKPTGNVVFYDGTSALGTVALAGGKASFTTSSLAVGTHSITAAYQGTAQFNISTSSAVSQVVKVATTTTSLTASLNPVNVNQHVTYTATVTGQFGGVCTGTMTFMDGSSTVAIMKFSGGQAAYRTKYNSLGSHAIAAIYSGDSNDSGSTSPAISENVVSSTKTTVTTSGSPSQVGQAVTFTATVVAKFGSVPAGELVTFSDATKLLASVPLTGGVAAFTTSSLSAKTHTITAHYLGDSSFTPSQGHVKQIVEP